MHQEPDETQSFSLFERILAYTAITLIVVAVLSFLATLISGMIVDREVLAQGFWPFLVWISYVGLPVGFVLLMVLLVTTFVKRSRSGREDRSKR